MSAKMGALTMLHSQKQRHWKLKIKHKYQKCIKK